MKKIEVTTLISIITILTGFAFWLGGLQKNVSLLNKKLANIDIEKIHFTIDEGIKKIEKLAAEANQFPVGTIVASLIEPNIFKRQFGDSWKLLDGANIIGTKLSALTKKERLPDAGGKFLRAINTKNDPETQDPDGVRAAGHYQSDDFRSHSHGTQGYDKAQWYGENLVHSAADVKYGKHTNTTLPSGGNETRPKNIAVYFYIRIN